MNKPWSSRLLVAWLALVLIGLMPEESQAQVADHGARLVELGQSYFQPLSRSEIKMLQAAASGSMAWLGSGPFPENLETKPSPENDPGQAKKYRWDNERGIRAEMVRWLALDPEAQKLTNPFGIHVIAGSILGRLNLSDITLRGPLGLVQCAIPDGIDLSVANAPVINLNGSVTGPIDAPAIMVSGNFLLKDGIYDGVDLTEAHIEGDLNCNGATFLNTNPDPSDPEPGAVWADEARIRGNSIFENIQTDRFVYLRAARINGKLSFDKALFKGTGKNGLRARFAVVDGEFYWRGLHLGPHTELELNDASVGLIRDEEASWPAAGNLFLDGFAYGDFDRDSPSDLNRRFRWLYRQRREFRPQPYRALSRVFNANGDEEDALDVQIAEEDDFLKWGQTSLRRKAAHWLFGATIKYGYKPLHSLWFVAIFVLFGWLLFWWGYRGGIMTPTDKEAYESFLQARPHAAPRGYQPFNSLIYSLESFLPLVDLYQVKYWLPNPQAGGRLLRCYLWLHILAGWFFTTMLVAGLTGLVHK